MYRMEWSGSGSTENRGVVVVVLCLRYKEKGTAQRDGNNDVTPIEKNIKERGIRFVSSIVILSIVGLGYVGTEREWHKNTKKDEAYIHTHTYRQTQSRHHQFIITLYIVSPCINYTTRTTNADALIGSSSSHLYIRNQ